ncbi:AAA family ATPase [Photobacterium leiognathi]|uniref:AAA family ATPase n=1 Tax=Photobacterium leiognathi TaxID=553611 RepID=UPI002980E8F0|nr:AAA family ATPase [Photobacterium leiognathi]
MVKSTDFIALATASLKNDKDCVRNICKVLASREKEGSQLKRNLNNLLSKFSNDGQHQINLVELNPKIKGLVYSVSSDVTVEDLALSSVIVEKVTTFIQEIKQKDQLADYGFSNSNKVMLSGPSGCGKTSLAIALSNELELPLYVLDFTQVISSFLGTTGAKLADVFRNLPSPCVLLVDEIDTVLTERSNQQTNKSDCGEAARIVTTLLIEIERLNSDIVLVGATNHPQMLDSAVGRRFDTHLCFEAPDSKIRQQWYSKFIQSKQNVEWDKLNIDLSTGNSIAELKLHVESVAKAWVLKQVC